MSQNPYLPEPVVTVVIPAYDVEQYINDAVESVTHTASAGEMKVVVVNDGSRDGTRARLDKLKQRSGAFSDFVVVDQNNLGVAAARNAGLREVDTPFVAFLDADDMFAPDFAETVLPALRSIADTDVDILEFNARCFEESGREVSPIRCADPSSSSSTVILDGAELNRSANRFNNYLWCRVFRTSLFADNTWFPEGRDYEDVAVVPTLYLRARRVHRLGVDAVIRRYRPGSIMRTPSVAKAQDWLECHRSALRAARASSGDFATSRYWSIIAARCFEGMVATVIALPAAQRREGRDLARHQSRSFERESSDLPAADTALRDAVMVPIGDLRRRQLRRAVRGLLVHSAGRSAWRRRLRRVSGLSASNLGYFWDRV